MCWATIFVNIIVTFDCLRFVARTGETDYVDIVPGGGGCYAEGPYRTGAGRMEIGLQQDGCIVLKEWDLLKHHLSILTF